MVSFRSAYNVFSLLDFQPPLDATANSWSCERRVVAKAEHLLKGKNPRFIVTSLTGEAVEAQELYEKVYRARGEMENCIKCQLDLFAHRTSAARLAPIS